MGKILRVTKAFSVLSDPNGHVYTPGELVDASHPHVKGREDCFETVEAHVSSRSSSVEQATAAPGEKRAVSKSNQKQPVLVMAEETCECGWPLDSFPCRIRHIQINTGDAKAAND